MIFGPSGNVHDAPNQLFLTLETPDYKKKTNTNNILFYFRSSQNIRNEKRKRRVPTNPSDPSYKFLKILNMGSISIKNMKSEHLSQNMKLIHIFN